MRESSAEDHTDPEFDALLNSDVVHGLIEEGNEQGFLSSTHVAATLHDVEFTAEQLEELLLAFADLGHRHRRGRRSGGRRGRGRGRAQARPLDQDDEQRSRAHVLPRDGQGAAAHGGRRGLAGQAHRASRHGRQAQAHRVQPAARGVHRQASRGPRHAAPRPHPGGQPRAHARRGEVRLPARLQVQHLRHLVDPPGHHPGAGRPGAHHPRAGAHGGEHQPARARAAPARAGDRPRADAGWRSPPRWASRPPRCATSSRSARSRPACTSRSATTATLSSATSSRTGFGVAGRRRSPRSLRREEIAEVLGLLTHRERNVLALRFGLDGRAPAHPRRGGTASSG